MYIEILYYVCILLIITFILYYFTIRKNIVNKNKIMVGELLHDSINLRYLNNFITADDCIHLIELAKDNMHRSRVISDGKEGLNPDRTSYSYYLPKSGDNIIKNIEKKVAELTKTNINKIEALQVVRYQEGQEFKAHYDWFTPDYTPQLNHNQRQYTIFVYLNDDFDEGETEFSKINKKIKPKKGDAAFWENCSDHTTCFNEALHQGKPPKNGIKYGLNIWVNFNDI